MYACVNVCELSYPYVFCGDKNSKVNGLGPLNWSVDPIQDGGPCLFLPSFSDCYRSLTMECIFKDHVHDMYHRG